MRLAANKAREKSRAFCLCSAKTIISEPLDYDPRKVVDLRRSALKNPTLGKKYEACCKQVGT